MPRSPHLPPTMPFPRRLRIPFRARRCVRAQCPPHPVLLASVPSASRVRAVAPRHGPRRRSLYLSARLLRGCCRVVWRRLCRPAMLATLRGVSWRGGSGLRCSHGLLPRRFSSLLRVSASLCRVALLAVPCGGIGVGGSCLCGGVCCMAAAPCPRTPGAGGSVGVVSGAMFRPGCGGNNSAGRPCWPSWSGRVGAGELLGVVRVRSRVVCGGAGRPRRCVCGVGAGAGVSCRTSSRTAMVPDASSAEHRGQVHLVFPPSADLPRQVPRPRVVSGHPLLVLRGCRRSCARRCARRPPGCLRLPTSPAGSASMSRTGVSRRCDLAGRLRVPRRVAFLVALSLASARSPAARAAGRFVW